VTDGPVVLHDLILPPDVVTTSRTPGEQVVEVTGDDRLSHLDATTTQALKDARPGTATAALVLDANGNPLAMFDVLVLPDRVWLVTPDAEVTAVVMELIAGRTFLADARFRVLDHRVVRAAVDPVRVGRAWSGQAVVPEAGTVRSTPTGDTMLAVDRTGLLTIAGPDAEVGRLGDLLRGAGVTDADAAQVRAWRVATGRPVWGAEVTPPHLPEELGLLPTHVHLAKGCYPGQEAVARMWMLGRPRRRLARVRVTGVDTGVLQPGWTSGEGRELVEVTTVGMADPSEPGMALAFVPGTAGAGQVLGEGPSIEVLALVGDVPTPPGHDPAMRRRRDRSGADGPPRRAA
jgi:tRNA-modifying protein YgfZ